jgi:hypothetical protein
MEKTITIIIYRWVTGNYHTEWRLSCHESKLEKWLFEKKAMDIDADWKLEAIPVLVPDYEIKPLIGFLGGSLTGGVKAARARINGLKGGRPKKPIDGLLSVPQSESEPIPERNLTLNF